MTKRKFYKVTFTIELLCEDEARAHGDWDLDDIKYQMTEGECSGVIKPHAVEELDGLQVANALMDQGSDTEFFGLTQSGTDTEEELEG